MQTIFHSATCERRETPTDGHALDPIVEVAHVEDMSLGALLES